MTIPFNILFPSNGKCGWFRSTDCQPLKKQQKRFVQIKNWCLKGLRLMNFWSGFVLWFEGHQDEYISYFLLNASFSERSLTAYAKLLEIHSLWQRHAVSYMFHILFGWVSARLVFSLAEFSYRWSFEGHTIWAQVSLNNAVRLNCLVMKYPYCEIPIWPAVSE